MVVLAIQTVNGLVWSLVLGNPVIDMKDESNVEANIEADKSVEDASDIEHPRNTKFKLASTSSLPAGSRPTRQHHGQVNWLTSS